MPSFRATLAARGTQGLRAAIKAEIEALDAGAFPLQQGLSHSSHVSADRVGATILRVEEGDDHIRVKAGLFYTGIIAGCSCSDDPTPVDDLTEYCEVWIDIDKATGEGAISLTEEED